MGLMTIPYDQIGDLISMWGIDQSCIDYVDYDKSPTAIRPNMARLWGLIARPPSI